LYLDSFTLEIGNILEKRTTRIQLLPAPDGHRQRRGALGSPRLDLLGENRLGRAETRTDGTGTGTTTRPSCEHFHFDRVQLLGLPIQFCLFLTKPEDFDDILLRHLAPLEYVAVRHAWVFPLERGKVFQEIRMVLYINVSSHALVRPVPGRASGRTSRDGILQFNCHGI